MAVLALGLDRSRRRPYRFIIHRPRPRLTPEKCSSRDSRMKRRCRTLLFPRRHRCRLYLQTRYATDVMAPPGRLPKRCAAPSFSTTGVRLGWFLARRRVHILRDRAWRRYRIECCSGSRRRTSVNYQQSHAGGRRHSPDGKRIGFIDDPSGTESSSLLRAAMVARSASSPAADLPTSSGFQITFAVAGRETRRRDVMVV